MERVPREIVSRLFEYLTLNLKRMSSKLPSPPKYLHVIPFGSTCHYLREIMLDKILSAPHFTYPIQLTDFSVEMVTKYPYKVKQLTLPSFTGATQFIDIVKECKGLEVLDLSMMHVEYDIGNVKLCQFSYLRTVKLRVRMKENMFLDFLSSLPQTVSSLGLIYVTASQIGGVAKYVNWIEEFGFEMLYSSPLEGLRESFECLVERNPKLMRLMYLKDSNYFNEVDWEAMFICHSFKKLEFSFNINTLNMTTLLLMKSDDFLPKLIVFKRFKKDIKWSPGVSTIPNIHNIIIKEFNITHLRIPSLDGEDYFQPFQDNAKYPFLKSLEIRTFARINPHSIYPHLIQFSNLQKLTTTMYFLSDISCYPPLPSVIYLSLDYSAGDLIFMDSLLRWLPQLKLLKLTLISPNIQAIEKDLEKIKTWTVAPPDMLIHYTNNNDDGKAESYLLGFQHNFSLSKIHLTIETKEEDYLDPDNF
eukprot:TRINITY_DN17707_c0_g1_i1.p1 TRINITY_DN17707_c0_g1~~TRINITY_DN17707_c0_g1_i1.p1  ORF type:complete len:473 (+),score=95.22 TRINITY_DN17707_c0_g1_i1:1-1419(+)